MTAATVRAMRRAAAVFALAALGCSAWLVPAGGARDRAACTPGAARFRGQDARVFCGAARATVRYGSKTLTFSQGSCDRTATYVTVNIGTVVLGSVKGAKPDYFGLVVGQVSGPGAKPAGSDGTYKGGILALDYRGKGYVIDGRSLVFTLTGGRTRGTFTGLSLFTNPVVKISGSFSC